MGRKIRGGKNLSMGGIFFFLEGGKNTHVKSAGAENKMLPRVFNSGETESWGFSTHRFSSAVCSSFQEGVGESIRSLAKGNTLHWGLIWPKVPCRGPGGATSAASLPPHDVLMAAGPSHPFPSGFFYSVLAKGLSLGVRPTLLQTPALPITGRVTLDLLLIWTI